MDKIEINQHTMKEQLISLKTATLAKLKGFGEPTLGLYFGDKEMPDNPYAVDWNGKGNSEQKNYLSAPTQSLLQKWLREKHNVILVGYSNASGFLWEMHKTVGGTHIADSGYAGPNDSGCWDVFEEAVEHGLQKALNMIPIK